MWRSDTNAFAPLDANVLVSSRFKVGDGVVRHTHEMLGSSDGPSVPAAVVPLPFGAPGARSGIARDEGLNVSETPMDQHVLSMEEELRQLRRLALRYRRESEGLRGQLKASALREELLSRRLEDAYREVARAKAEAGHAFANRACSEEESQVRLTLQAREHELRTLQVRHVELEGRLKAYEEVWGRDSQPSGCSGETPRVTDVLCECWSDLEYLVKVVNAVHHCQHVPHDDRAPDARAPAEAHSTCSRPLAMCEARCCQAALKGNDESEVDVRRRGHGLSLEELALNVREEIQYCVAMSVRCAAERAASCEPFSLATASDAGEDNAAAVICNNDGTSVPPPEPEPRKHAEVETSACGQTGHACREDPLSHDDEAKVGKTTVLPHRVRRTPRPHTTTEDCQVQ